MKKIVLTGGTGLIGQPLTKKLAAERHQVVILSRSPQKYLDQFPSNIRIVSWDAQWLGEWIKEIDGADVVINLASESIAGEKFLPDKWTPEKKHKILKSRLFSSEAVVEAIRMAKIKPKVLLQASAIGYYGPRGDEWVSEQSSTGQDFLSSVAVEWENASQEVESMGVRRVILRTGLVLTTEGGPLTRMMFPFKLYGGGPYGSGRQWYSWIHIDDLVDAVSFLMDNEQISGPVNLVSPNPVTNKEFAKSLGRAMKRPSLVPLPSFVMRKIVGEASTLVLDGQKVSSSYLQDQGFQFRYANLDLALESLITQSDKRTDSIRSN